MNVYEHDFKNVTGYDFNKYYVEYCPKLTWYLASRYTKDLDKAKDFANQAFMQALEKIDLYDKDKSRLITWLTKIAINLVIKDWKDAHKYDFISLERDTEDAPSILNLLKSDDGSGDSIYDNENKKKAEIIYDVIESLPEKYKKVMIMRELEHMAYKDIAEAVKKEIKINIKNKEIDLDSPEDFYSLELRNRGDNRVEVIFKNDNNVLYKKYIDPNENLLLNRDEIEFDRKGTILSIIGYDTIVDGSYVVTTNLSTIKSQIKKGRETIQRKVDRKFKKISSEGLI